MKRRHIRVVFHVNGKIAGCVDPDAKGIALFVMPEDAGSVRAETWIDGTFLAGEFYTQAFRAGDTLSIPVDAELKRMGVA